MFIVDYREQLELLKDDELEMQLALVQAEMDRRNNKVFDTKRLKVQQ